MCSWEAPAGTALMERSLACQGKEGGIQILASFWSDPIGEVPKDSRRFLKGEVRPMLPLVTQILTALGVFMGGAAAFITALRVLVRRDKPERPE